MPSTQQFRKRIKSVRNTSQITRAMEMVASVKMQKAVKSIISARSYVQNSWNLLEKLAGLTDRKKHPLLAKREVKKTALIVIASNRGLCGSYNTDILRKLTAFLKTSNRNLEIIAVGKKAAEAAKKVAADSLVAEFSNFEAGVQFEEIGPIASMVIDGFRTNKYDRVAVIYSHFESSLRQTPAAKQILPIEPGHIDLPHLWEQKDGEDKLEYKFEPDADAVLERIVPQFIKMQIFGAFLEANASENSARMVAMKSATDNARDLIDELTLVYNSIRQGSITREIAEISGAAEAMK